MANMDSSHLARSPLPPAESIDTVFRAAPGTEILYDQEDTQGNRQDISHHLHNLQHVKKGDSHILLVPQPSLTDPNDPLSWPAWKKWAAFANALTYSFLGGVTGPIMAAWMVQGSEFFHRSLSYLTYANGATLICQGVATTLWMPFAIKYGRRPVYLLSTLLMVVACVWVGVASGKKYTVFFLGRAFLGVVEAPIESIVPSTVTDLFFLHDRGAKVSLYGLSVLSGNELGPMLSAFIIQTLGMDWAYYIVGMFLFANFVGMIFLMPETKYLGYRPSILPAKVESSPSKTENGSEKEKMAAATASHHDVSEEEDEEAAAEAKKKRSYLQELSPWTASDPDVGLLRTFIRPFILITYPTVIWSCFIYGLALSWNVIIGSTVAQLFAPPPYLFTSAQQGLVFLSPFIGSLVGTYLCGPLADRIANFYTRRNHGIREPEMRLPTCIIAALFTFAGAVISGICLQHKTHWAAPVVGWGVLSVGGQMGATLGMNYSLDCHAELSVELMVTIASLKSAIAWIWTWVINDWIARDGPLVVFISVGAVNVAVYLTTFLFYFKGKNIRLWLHERNMLGEARG